VSVLASLFDITRKDLKRMRPMAQRINALEPTIQSLSDAQLRAKTDEFRQRLQNGETLDDLLIEAFAVVREVARRTLGMRHFDVQLIGGMVLHEGKIAEMKTGEGKTLVAALPLYLNALTGRGVHLVTHNDYLARRDREWMGPIYEFLGLTVGCLQHSMEEAAERKAEYACDITYGVNHEFGFDYLRDNMAQRIEGIAQRDLHYAIVDEVDSLLVDEARTPLILSGPGTKPTAMYERVDKVVGRLHRETDYSVDEKSKTATLTEQGVRQVEQVLNIPNISDIENAELFSHVNAALRAHACYQRDRDYVVREGQVIIVDEFTGRLMFGRRYSEGLHQAIEAKEGVKIERESQTVATITHQNYFRLYEKLAGMTGTAKTEEQEFLKIYNMPVVVVPTNLPMIRADNSDVVYKTEEAKFRGIVGEILHCESRGQPTLVGTRSIEVSEKLSGRLGPEMLRLFAQLSLLHDYLVNAKSLPDAVRAPLRAVLDDRLRVVRREREHLERALEQFEGDPMRMRQPEEQVQLERRLNKVSGLEQTLAGLMEKLGSGQGLSGGEIRRLADVITYEKLEEVKSARLPALLQACAIDPDPGSGANVEALARLIGLDGGTGRLRHLLDTGIPHQVLNAKYHEQEAQIIANAGRSGTVTIATNMAGRGVDILLGGSPQRVADELLQEQGVDPPEAAPEQMPAARERAKAICEEDRKRVLETGGLHILGTERHESRRIDNQLRGRAGRQGDPGSSRFYLSMEDELMRLFGPERFDFLLNRWDECEPIEAKLISRTIENAQRKVEQHHFSMRQHVLQYDDVKNLQREVIYAQRRKVLQGADLTESILESLQRLVEQRVAEFAGSEVHPNDYNLEALYQSLYEIFPIHFYLKPEDLQGKRHEELLALLQATIAQAYNDREQDLGPETMRDIERMITLNVIDTKWVDHLDAMEFLEEGIGLRGYGGTDPLVAFKKEAFETWQTLLAGIQEEIARLMFRVQLVREEKRRPSPYDQVYARSGKEEEPEKPRPFKKKTGRVGRNDPCPCGSGKKYKRCCMGKA
jgi:preprotein translocase subunit SecA